MRINSEKLAIDGIRLAADFGRHPPRDHGAEPRGSHEHGDAVQPGPIVEPAAGASDQTPKPKREDGEA